MGDLTLKSSSNSVIADIKSVLLKPKSTFQSILESTNNYFSPKHLIFTLVMNLYYLFIPSFLLLLNILIFVAPLILVAMAYYFAQDGLLLYKDNTAKELEDKFFYRIAYCFALANLPTLIFALLVNYIPIIFSEFLVVGIFWAIVLSTLLIFLAPIYPLKLLAVLTGQNFNLPLLMDLLSTSFLLTIKEKFGLKALQEITVDLRTS
jgi:hypothetical protein